MRFQMLLFAPALALSASAVPCHADTSYVTGSAYYVERLPMPPGAVLRVALIDLSEPSDTARVAEQIIRKPSNVPVTFRIPYDSAAIDPQRSYGVSARIIVNDRQQWVTEPPVPVLTAGHSNNVSVRMRRYMREQPLAPGSAAVTGRIAYRERIAVPAGAVLTVTLEDVSRADAPSIQVGKQVISSLTRVPVPFRVEYNAADIVQNHSYVVRARIDVGGKLRWMSDTATPVITRGAPSEANIMLKAVPAG